MIQPELPLLVVIPEALNHIVAYVGPGAGLTAIGVALAFIVGILMTILGFVWYPLKRMFRLLRKQKTQVANDSPAEAKDGSSLETSA